MVGLIKLENVVESHENWPLSWQLLKSSLITSSIQYFPQGRHYLSNMKVDVQLLWIYRISYVMVTRYICTYFMSHLSSCWNTIHPTKFPSQKYKKKINQGVHADPSTMPQETWSVKERKYIPWRGGDLLHTLIAFWHSPGNASQLLQVSFPCRKVTSSSINVKETESKRKSSSWETFSACQNYRTI